MHVLAPINILYLGPCRLGPISGSYPNGFASFPDTAHSGITESGQITSTRYHYHRFCFDVMGWFWVVSNKALSKGDSRQIINRGFQVDATHPMEISARNNDKNGLTECLGLLFITFTANHAKTPGLQFIYHWKRSEKGSSIFLDYHTLSDASQKEPMQAMEESYGPVLLRNWVEVRTLILVLERSQIVHWMQGGRAFLP